MGSDTASDRHGFREGVPVRWPIIAPLVVLGVAMVLRVVDIYVLRLDERLGEIILSKSLGLALVVGYLWWVGGRVSAIGLHSRRQGSAIAIGAGITLAAFLVGTIFQILTLGPGRSLTLQAVDPKTDMTGGAAFAVFLVVGNVINSFMEEGLFRGLMLSHFLQRMQIRKANLLQASLFAAWHLVWPIKAYLSDEVSAIGAVAQAGLLLLGTFVSGLVYGVLLWRTGSLWAPMIAHFLNNTILNFVQVRSSNGELEPAVVLSIVVVVVIAILSFVVAPLAKRLALRQLPPWPQSSTRERQG